MKAVVFATCLVAASAFTEDFSGDWESRWVQSKAKSDYGVWDVSAGKFFGDAEISKGLRTTQNAKNYAISTKFDEPVDGSDKLVLQMTVKHEQGLGCGGGYMKVMKSGVDLSNFHGGEDETPYNIMFGPDRCGPSKKMVHIIFNHEGKNLLWKKEEKCPDDKLTHLYTLIVDAKKQTYELLIDGESKKKGSLEEDWDFLPAKEIDDPEDKKPADWVDAAEIDDPKDEKPDGWDDIPAQIADPDATKPDDWDEEEDGEWEAPQIPNPEFKGEWKPKRIPNPEYKGVWKPKRIPNPEYKPNDKLATYSDNGAVGFDLWQVESGSIFDNIYIGTSVKEAEKLAKKGFHDLKDKEKKAKDADEEAARKAAEEASAAEKDTADESFDADEDDEL